jgi:tripartite-type tricarboxylate transporter receptor subunit TctC
LLPKVPYEVERDLSLISGSWRLTNLLVVNNDVPVKTVGELVAYARRNPGKLAFASDGNGTTAHLGMELFKSMTGTSILHVPYKAASSGVTDLIGGGVQLMMANTPVVTPHVQAGRMRALGITSVERSAAYPQIAPVAVAVPGFEVVSWGGIVGPAGLPKEIVTRLNNEIRIALASPAVVERFRTLGAEPAPSTPEQFRDLSRRETEKWAKVVKFSGAKID